jgi:putative transcriptional regulator
MPPLKTIVMACATLTALTAAEPAGFEGSGLAGGQLRSGSVRELATGKLLVAARGLPDPNYAETVILLAEHSEEGSMGLVINHRTDVPVARLFPNLKQAQGRASALFVGGPVSQDGVLALLRSTSPTADSRRVLEDVYLVATAKAIEEPIVEGTDQSRFRVYLGYAGWGAGQLERETLHGSWHVFRAETTVVFDPDPDTLWQRQVRRTDDRMVLALP